jgi:hypothetical protein
MRTGSLRVCLVIVMVTSLLMGATPAGAAPAMFGPATNFAVGNGPGGIVRGDFDGDGNPDLVVANYNSNNISVLVGDGNGGFGKAKNFAVGDEPTGVISGDFDGDGKPDLAVANYKADNVSVLLNTTDGKREASSE